MLSTCRRLFGLSPLLVLVAAGMAGEPSEQGRGGQAEKSPSTEETKERRALIQQHNELVPRIKKLWGQGHVAKAYAGLQKLLVIYQKFYPRAQFPDGHEHIVRCYRDLCRLADRLGKSEAVLQHSQDGLAMCERLYSRDEFPHGHVMTTCMLGNLGNAWSQNGYPAKAYRRINQCIQMSAELWAHGSKGLAPESVAEMHVSAAECCSLRGDIPQALHHAKRAVEIADKLPDSLPYLERCETCAECHLAHGRTLISVGDYQAATTALKKALDLSLQVFLARRSPESRLALIDAHIANGILRRHKSNLPQAKSQLSKARKLGEGSAIETALLLTRLSQIEGQISWMAELDAGYDQLLFAKTLGTSEREKSQLKGSAKELAAFRRFLTRGAELARENNVDAAEKAFLSAKDVLGRLLESGVIDEGSPSSI